MFRSAALVLLASLATEALAQAVTHPTVTASAGAMRAVFTSERVTSNGREEFADVRELFAVGLGGEIPVVTRNRLTASTGIALRAASDVFGEKFRVQNLNAYGRLGTAQGSALLGVSIDLGDGLFGSGFAVNSDGQHALFGQLRGEAPAGPVVLFAQAEGSITFATTQQILFTTIDDPDVRIPADSKIDNGDSYSVQFGAVYPVGPVSLGLAVLYAARTSGTLEYVEDEIPGIPAEFLGKQEFQYGYSEALGFIPSVAYRTRDERVTVRVEGSFSGYFSMENIPVGITWTNENGPKTRPAVTLSVSVGL